MSWSQAETSEVQQLPFAARMVSYLRIMFGIVTETQAEARDLARAAHRRYPFTEG